MYLPHYAYTQCRRLAGARRARTTGACRACPKEPQINCCAQHSGLLRTYSARIYFIVSNSSLACLHMPHPSNPVDDIRARPLYRELWLAPFGVRVSRTFGSLAFVFLVSDTGWTCQRVGRRSDGLHSV